jgi:hypothetical protein
MARGGIAAAIVVLLLIFGLIFGNHITCWLLMAGWEEGSKIDYKWPWDDDYSQCNCNHGYEGDKCQTAVALTPPATGHTPPATGHVVSTGEHAPGSEGGVELSPCTGTEKIPTCNVSTGDPSQEEQNRNNCTGYTTSNAPSGQGYRCIWSSRKSCDSYLPAVPGSQAEDRLCRLSGSPGIAPAPPAPAAPPVPPGTVNPCINANCSSGRIYKELSDFTTANGMELPDLSGVDIGNDNYDDNYDTDCCKWNLSREHIQPDPNRTVSSQESPWKPAWGTAPPYDPRMINNMLDSMTQCTMTEGDDGDRPIYYSPYFPYRGQHGCAGYAVDKSDLHFRFIGPKYISDDANNCPSRCICPDDAFIEYNVPAEAGYDMDIQTQVQCKKY